jgi:hypothetical protein
MKEMKTMFPREFVEWLISGYYLWTDCTGLENRTVIEIDDKEYSLDDAYKYWLFNVKSMEFKVTGQ